MDKPNSHGAPTMACPKCGTGDSLLVCAAHRGYCVDCQRGFRVERPLTMQDHAQMLERCWRI